MNSGLNVQAAFFCVDHGISARRTPEYVVKYQSNLLRWPPARQPFATYPEATRRSPCRLSTIS